MWKKVKKNPIKTSTKKNSAVILSNSSPKSKVQTSVLGLGVDFVLPLSQEQEQQEQEQEQEEPPPKLTGVWH